MVTTDLSCLISDTGAVFDIVEVQQYCLPSSKGFELLRVLVAKLISRFLFILVLSYSAFFFLGFQPQS
jgi:hypothetical protein